MLEDLLIYEGLGAALVLNAARMYIGGQSGFNMYCALGGAVIAVQVKLLELLGANAATQIINTLSLGGRADGGAVLVGLIGAAAYELAYDSGIGMGDLNYGGAVRAVTGAAAALVGTWLGQYVENVISPRVAPKSRAAPGS